MRYRKQITEITCIIALVLIVVVCLFAECTRVGSVNEINGPFTVTFDLTQEASSLPIQATLREVTDRDSLEYARETDTIGAQETIVRRVVRTASVGNRCGMGCFFVVLFLILLTGSKNKWVFYETARDIPRPVSFIISFIYHQDELKHFLFS